MHYGHFSGFLSKIKSDHLFFIESFTTQSERLFSHLLLLIVMTTICTHIEFNSENPVYCGPRNWTTTHYWETKKMWFTATEIRVGCERISVFLHQKAQTTACGNFISKIFDTILNYLLWYCLFVQNYNVLMSFTLQKNYVIYWDEI